MTVDTTGTTASTSDNLPVISVGDTLAKIKANLPEVSEDFQDKYPAFREDVDIDELMAETMGEGRTLRVQDLTMIKVPSADASKVFMIPDENGNKAPAAKGISGIPVAWTERRSYWESEDVTGAPPDCTSDADMKYGRGAFGPGSTENPNGLCSECPMAQRGSAGTGTAASKCKEQRMLFLLTDDEVFPYVVIFPPASLGNFTKFGAFLAKKGRRGPQRPELGPDPVTGRPMRASAWLTCEVTLQLAQDTNSKGVAYNAITIEQVRKLDPAEVEWVNAYGRTIDQMIVQREEAMDDLLGRSGADAGDKGAASGMTTDPHGGTDSDIDLGGFEDEAEIGADADATAGR